MNWRVVALLLTSGISGAASKPTCCWSKWGDESSCSEYSGTGAQCNTDHTKTCNSDTDCPDQPAPAPPAPAPPSPPSPPSPPAPIPGELISYWDLTWSPVSAPKGANVGIAFSGWNDPTNAISESNAVRSSLVGAKWIDAGGGGLNGRWNVTWINKWDLLIKGGGLKDWAGIVLDVEECFDSGLAEAFAGLLRTAKTAGLGTMVTTSHSAPYMCDDAKDLMKSFFISDDVDYLSPQLYAEGGDKTLPSFVVTSGAGVEWSDWVGSKPRFVPSLTKPCLDAGCYEKVKEYYAKMNIEVLGYVEWPTATSTNRNVIV